MSSYSTGAYTQFYDGFVHLNEISKHTILLYGSVPIICYEISVLYCDWDGERNEVPRSGKFRDKTEMCPQ